MNNLKGEDNVVIVLLVQERQLLPDHNAKLQELSDS